MLRNAYVFSPLGHSQAKSKVNKGHRTIFDISNSALALASSNTASCPCCCITFDRWGKKSPTVLLPAALPSWWASPRSRAPRCGGGWGAAGGGSCCWACPGTGGSGAWAAPSAASWRAPAAGWHRRCCTCSRDTGTSVGNTQPPLRLNLQFPPQLCPPQARPPETPLPPFPPVMWNTPPPAQPLLASPAPIWSPLMFLVALKREETLSYLGRRCVWRLQENLSAPSLLGLMMLEEKAEDVIQQPDQASSQRVCVGWKSTFIYSTGFSWNTKIKVGWASGLIYQAC